MKIRTSIDRYGNGNSWIGTISVKSEGQFPTDKIFKKEDLAILKRVELSWTTGKFNKVNVVHPARLEVSKKIKEILRDIEMFLKEYQNCDLPPVKVFSWDSKEGKLI